jgi:hypothetical protein
MPVLIPFAFGVMLGVCIAPSVRTLPSLKPLFLVVDEIQASLKDAFCQCQKGCSPLGSLNGNHSRNLTNGT